MLLLISTCAGLVMHSNQVAVHVEVVTENHENYEVVHILNYLTVYHPYIWNVVIFNRNHNFSCALSTKYLTCQLLFAMVNRRISMDLKECALQMWELGWDQVLIIESLGVSHASLYCWQALFSEFNSVVRPPSPLMG